MARLRIAALLATLSLAVPPMASAQSTSDTTAQPEATSAVGSQTAVRAKHYMVVAANPLAAEAGYGVLAQGGSAADAAVAVQMVLNLVEPQSSGIGGGAFALYWNAASGELVSLDGRETAPAAATPDYWLGPDGSPIKFRAAVASGRSVGVPGTLKLMEDLHARYGRLPWANLLAPAVALAEDGFEVSGRLAAAIADAPDIGEFPAARAYFLDAEGAPLAAGTRLRNPALAQTLRLIAAEKSAPLHTGAIARDIVAAVRTETNPGMLTLDDLAGYRVKVREPVCMAYRVYEVCGMGPPSSGAQTVGQILGILAAFDLPALGDRPEAAHLFLEASKLAFADRGLYIADPDFVDMPAGLLDPDYLAARAAMVDARHAMPAPVAAGEPPWDETQARAPDDAARPEHGTSHMVIVDGRGDMVSLTTTIEDNMGSRVMTGGFLLNNELTDFAFTPEADGKPVANRVEGGKRPRSSMAPTIVFRDGQPVLLIGSPGGSRIIPYVAWALAGILDFGLDPQAAIDRPHLVNRNAAESEVEDGPDAAARIAALAGFGQTAAAANLNSGLAAIAIAPDGTLTGAADRRREGLAIGD